MDGKRMETAFDRLAIYEKVKILEGENFVTVEDTRSLSADELEVFIRNFEEDLAFKDVPHINVLIGHQFSVKVEAVLSEEGFQLHDEIVNVHKELNDENLDQNNYFTCRNLNDITEPAFMDIWERSMADSPNAPSSLTMNEQMRSVKKELGAGYRDSCIAVFENDVPIGVVMPHIEPGTTEEGRLFYIGLLPEERGKGKSKALHSMALTVLRNEFKASYYTGSTSASNTPMLNTFKANGCIVSEHNRLYRKTT